MGWKDDHMWICFPHSKTDQVGERNEPKSIYANPICPAICPILAMGVYLMSHSPDTRKLFPGGSQYHRFVNCLQKVMTLPERAVCQELQRLGMNKEDLGTHSIRKGAATYCTSG
ncbi:hypothetical protein GUITHDRAFT_43555, partial [Guillardia theta CCMP2712]